MAKVELRKEAPARSDTTRGEGYVNESDLAISTVRQAADQMPADPYALKLRRLVYDGCAAAEACDRLLRGLADEYQKQHAAQEGIIRGARAQMAATVSPMGHSDPSDYRGKVAEVQDAAERGITGAIAQSVLGAASDQAAKVGADFAASLQALSDEIDTSISDARSPTGLRKGSDSSLAKLTQLSAIQRGYESRQFPAAQIEQAFVALVKAGDAERITDLIDAVGPTLADIRNGGNAKRGVRSSQGGNVFDPGGELEIANKLVRMFDAWQASVLPKSILIGVDGLADLSTVFRVTCGTGDHRLLSRGDFTRLYIDGNGAAADAAMPWQMVDSTWTQRAIPGLRSSGWVGTGAIVKGGA